MPHLHALVISCEMAVSKRSVRLPAPAPCRGPSHVRISAVPPRSRHRELPGGSTRRKCLELPNVPHLLEESPGRKRQNVQIARTLSAPPPGTPLQCVAQFPRVPLPGQPPEALPGGLCTRVHRKKGGGKGVRTGSSMRACAAHSQLCSSPDLLGHISGTGGGFWRAAISAGDIDA